MTPTCPRQYIHRSFRRCMSNTDACHSGLSISLFVASSLNGMCSLSPFEAFQRRGIQLSATACISSHTVANQQHMFETTQLSARSSQPPVSIKLFINSLCLKLHVSQPPVSIKLFINSLCLKLHVSQPPVSIKLFINSLCLKLHDCHLTAHVHKTVCQQPIFEA